MLSSALLVILLQVALLKDTEQRNFSSSNHTSSWHGSFGMKVPPGLGSEPGPVSSPGVGGRPGPVGPPGVGGRPGPVGPPGVGRRPGPVSPPGVGGRRGPVGPPGVGRRPAPVSPPGVGGRPGPAGPPGVGGRPGPVSPSGLGRPEPVGPTGVEGRPGRVGPTGSDSPGSINHPGPPGPVAPLQNIFIKQILVPKICSNKEVFDKKTNKCRHLFKLYYTIPVVPSFQPKVLSMPLNELYLKIPNFERKKLTCAVPEKYHRNEYTMSSGNTSAVIIKKTREVIQFEDYYINDTETANESQAIYVCRQRFNCSNEWLQLDKGGFLVLKNGSILVNGSKRLYDKSEYIWKNHSVLICSNTSMEFGDDMVLGNLNCSGEWGRMESDEFTILNNQSIYVNASRTLYDPRQYIWQNQSLYICDNFTGDHDAKATLSELILSFLTFVCMSISIIALVFVLVTYSLFAELRTPPGINLMNLSVAILLAQLLWLVGSKQLTDKPVACTVIAVLLHYFFLVSFVWTSIIAFDTWRAFTAKGRRPVPVSKRKKMMHILRYMAVGWLSVMVYVVICVALDQSETVSIGYGSRAVCWITNFNAKWFFFATPLGLVTIFNIVFFSMTVKAIRSTRSQAKMVDNSANKRDFGVYVRIASVMGFTWIFGFAAPFGWVFLWYVYVVLSSLQGIYIAIAFALNKRARNLYIKLLRKKKESGSSDGHIGYEAKPFPISTKVVSRKKQVEVVIL